MGVLIASLRWYQISLHESLLAPQPLTQDSYSLSEVGHAVTGPFFWFEKCVDGAYFREMKGDNTKTQSGQRTGKTSCI